MISEKQKMLSGLPFNALDPELVKERKRAKALCFEYNQLHPDQKGMRQQKLSKLLGQGFKPTIKPNFQCDYGYNIQLGENVYINHNGTILDAAPVTIGNNVMIGPNVVISTATHPLLASERKKGTTEAAAITIAQDVWIGMGATILPGVTIDEGAVIAAGSVVTKDVAKQTLVAGVPAKVLKKIT